MNRYRVYLTDSAARDVREIHAWYVEQSLAAADLWLAALNRAIVSLEFLPERCGSAADQAFLRRVVRQLTFGSRHGRYRILFEIKNRRVLVLRVRHAARRPLNGPEDS